MIHSFRQNGLCLAIDTPSGAVHVLDETAFFVLNAVSREELLSGILPQHLQKQETPHSAGAIRQSFDELHGLAEAGLLYSEDNYSAFTDKLGLAPVKAMCLHVAHDCNLRCKYCFASTGNFGGSRSLMNLETARAAIDLLVRLSDNRRNLEVDFFGGEPLMNFEVVRQTVDYARSIEDRAGKHFRFTITTNGLGLDADNTAYINREMDNAVLSLDGRKPVNDAMRVTPSGAGSYDIIVPKYQKLVAQRGAKEYYVRGTYTSGNLDFDKDVLALAKLGFEQISVEPVVGPDTDSYAIKPEHLPKIKQSYEALVDAMRTRNRDKPSSFNFFHFMLDLDNGPCAVKRLKGCGSGNEYVAVTPDGEIYPCHQFVGNPDFLMGYVHSGITNRHIKEDFSKAHLLNKTDCAQCWAKYHCSGGCNANNYTFGDSILKPHRLSCELEKMRLECAIALRAYLSLESANAE